VAEPAADLAAEPAAVPPVGNIEEPSIESDTIKDAD
jgi:hypothetical protein